jgi:WD40 repeat protein
LTGQPSSPEEKHAAAITSLSFSPDGRKLVVTWGRFAQIHDGYSGKGLGPFLRHEDEVDSASFSANGEIVVTKSYYGRAAWMWDAETSQPIAPPVRHAGNVDRAVFAPGNKLLLTASDDGARLWPVSREERPHEDLDLVYRLLSANYIDQFGNTATLDVGELQSIWNKLQAKYRDGFTVSRLAELAWYQERAGLLENLNLKPFEQRFKPSAAIFYLKRLLQNNPADQKVLEHLRRAESNLETGP